MQDFDMLIEKANEIGLKVIMDIALNHTSNMHFWFQDAIENENSKYRDYYIFRKGKSGSYPNNWISSKTLKSTWTYNENTDDYYLHIYTKYQPDLNWESPKLRAEVTSILNFWIDKGVAGFRLDVINKIAKPKDLENVFSYRQFADYLYENNPKSYKYIDEIRQSIKSDDILLMGQLSAVNVQQAIDYINHGTRLDLFLQFEHIDIDKGEGGTVKKWNVEELKDAIINWQGTDKAGALPTVFLGSHDSPRMVNHYTDARRILPSFSGLRMMY